MNDSVLSTYEYADSDYNNIMVKYGRLFLY